MCSGGLSSEPPFDQKTQGYAVKQGVPPKMPCPNSFVKNELQETLVAYSPADGIYNVLDPCSRCINIRSGSAKPWEFCMRQRRSCLRRNEEHPVPTIRRVHVNNVRQSFQEIVPLAVRSSAPASQFHSPKTFFKYDGVYD